MDELMDLSRPPEFLANVIEFADEQVVGFRPLTRPRTDQPNRVEVTGYQLVTVCAIYEFGMDGICYRATMLHPTRTI
jgi:hypothetical protein